MLQVNGVIVVGQTCQNATLTCHIFNLTPIFAFCHANDDDDDDDDDDNEEHDCND